MLFSIVKHVIDTKGIAIMFFYKHQLARLSKSELTKLKDALPDLTGLRTCPGAEWSAMAVKRAIDRGTEERAASEHFAATAAEMPEGSLWGAIQRARRLRGE